MSLNILSTCLLDSEWILWEELICWSLLGVKGSRWQSKLFYLGLCISIRPLSIEGPSNELNWERHSEAAVDVSALSLFCQRNAYKTRCEDNCYDKYSKKANNGNRTEWSVLSNSVCNHMSDRQNRRTSKQESNLLITSLITDQMGQHKVLLPINKTIAKFEKEPSICYMFS